MAGPRAPLLAALLATALSCRGGAEESAPAGARPRNVSPRISAAISEQLPKYDPAAAAPAAAAPVSGQPRNGIIRLPTYIVRAARPPSEEDMLTEKGREDAAATRYLGPRQGLDRSLNRHTLTELWQAIPLLGRIPFVPFASLNNGQRALAVFAPTERKRRFAELLELEATARKLEQEATEAKAPSKNSTPPTKSSDHE